MQLHVMELRDNHFVGTVPEAWGNVTKVSPVIGKLDDACPVIVT